MSDLRDFTGKAEIYGFIKTDTNADGIFDSLTVVTTNGGAQQITNTQYNSFNEVVFGAVGMTFSINAQGNLIATIDN
jgi:hypothetical protein